jgi:Tol biopolymer transport system component
MGEVYRATDSTLGRQVALKVLPEAMASDPDRLARFEREARALAALNHPNIAQIHGLEERDGVRALVMELVEGTTLADRVASGSLSIEEALPVAEQVAEALEAAHDGGIVHRDLKPANVMTDTASGRVKVLDFGLAKRLSSATEAELTTLSGSPAATQAGTLMGTLPYMSPEQVRGQPLDARSDLWAFGCLLYELLVGRSPFRRATSPETIAAILGEPADLESLPPATPPRVRLLLERCLRKAPRDRLHHAADARIELSDAATPGPPADDRGPGRRSVPRGWLPAAALAGLLVGVVATQLPWPASRGDRGPAPAPVQPVTFSVPLPAETSVGPGEVQTYLAVSPDGESLAIADAFPRAPLQLHSFRDATTTPLPGTEDAATPVWSPDGRFIAFFAEGELKKVDVAGGGPPQALAPLAWEAGLSWSRDDVLLVSQPSEQGIAIHRLSAAGGEPSPVTHVDPEREIAHMWPQFLPDGRRFLYLALDKSSAQDPVRTLYLASLDGRERRAIPGVASRAIYAPPGFLLYVAEGTLVAHPFDLERGELVGDPEPVSSRLRYFKMTGQAEFSASTGAERSLVAFHGGPWRSQLVAYDRTGTPVETVGEPAAFHEISLSPDGRQLAVAVLDPSNGGRDLWVYSLDTGRARRLTLHPPDERSPVWSPDGRRILFRSDVGGPPDLYAQDATGGGEPELILHRPTVLNPEDWSRDGRLVLYQETARATGSDQWLLPLGGGTAEPLLNTRYSEWGGRLSPDGRWVAFVSDESGTFQVYVAPVRDPRARRVVSTGWGLSPRWRADGRELFYLGTGPAVIAVGIEASAGLEIQEPSVLFALEHPVFKGAWDAAPDGRLFVVNHVIEDTSRLPVTVMLGWEGRLEASARGTEDPHREAGRDR